MNGARWINMPAHAWIQACMPMALAFVVTAAITPIVILVTTRYGLVAAPRADRWHSRPTALMGGIGIFAGTTAAWIIFGDGVTVRPLLLPAIGIFVLGLVDDRLRLRPHIKLIGQLVAAGVLFLGGI